MRRIASLAALALISALALSGCSKDGETKVADTKPASETLKEGKDFLAANKAKPGVVTLPSGLQYKILQSGPATGGHPQLGDEVKLHYEGKLIDGTVFDSSFERGVPLDMPLRQLVQGWLDIVPMMRPGDVWEVYVPAELGYGKEGKGDVPPNAVMIFRMELIDFLPSGLNNNRG